MLIKKSERVFVCGKTQSGKSFLAKQIYPNYSSVVVFDFKPSQTLNDLLSKGFVIIKNPNDWKPKISEEGRVTGKFIYRPDFYNEDHFQTLINKIYYTGNTVIVIDDYSSKKYDVLPSVENAIRRGAERNVGVWIITQKSSLISSLIFDQAEHFFCFKMRYKFDRNKMEGVIGDGVEEGIKNLDGYEFIYYNHSLKDPVVCEFKNDKILRKRALTGN